MLAPLTSLRDRDPGEKSRSDPVRGSARRRFSQRMSAATRRPNGVSTHPQRTAATTSSER
jgi:hypothetical protein